MTDRQANTEVYERKHAEALAKIRTAFAAAGAADDTEDLKADLAKANAENASLNEELEALKAQRSRDVSELDTLIAQLKPLIGEA